MKILQKEKTNKSFTRLLTLSLYVVFFFVQLLFNFDFSDHQKNNVSNHYTVGSQHTNFLQHISKQEKPSSAKKNIRLNKRFQPESIVDCAFPIVEPFVKYTTPIFLSPYYNAAVLSSFLFTRSLRGPPVIT